MKVDVFGTVPEHAIICIGTWNPILPQHIDLFARLNAHAESQSTTGVVVLLTPDPPQFIHGPAIWPDLDAVQFRVQEALRSGVKCVLVGGLEPSDLSLSAAMFLGTLLRFVRVREIWMGRNQSLGQGDTGNAAAIDNFGREHSVKITRLKRWKGSEISSVVRECVRNGHFAKACDILGRPLVVRAPDSCLDVRVQWPIGNYSVRTADEPDSAKVPVVHRPAKDCSSCETVLVVQPQSLGKFVFVLEGPGDMVE